MLDYRELQLITQSLAQPDSLGGMLFHCTDLSVY